MEVDVIILMDKGLAVVTKIIADETTAEAVFDSMLEDLIKQRDLDSIEDISTAIDYGFKVDQVNRYLQDLELEFIWQTRIEVNLFINED